MGKRVLDKLTYGLFVVTANLDGGDNGCIVNTVQQVTNSPDKICVAINKSGYTHDMVLATGVFNVSVISEDADFALFKRFGFQSGREVDKFKDYADWKRSGNGIAYITKGVNSYISAKVEHYMDLGTHTLFIAAVEQSESLSDVSSASYSYYHEHIKQTPAKTEGSSQGQTVWRCKICGYEYVGEELPEDYICPICKHPASDFEKVTK